MSSSQPAGGQGPPQSAPQGPPYMPQVATLGGVPNIDVDVPIAAVFLALFVISAALNMTIFQINRRRGHKFIFSVLLFGFSMARITTLVMRIVWATRPLNVSVAIAAQIFVAAGVLLLFVVNLIFAQRVLRAYQPWAWHPAVGWAFRALWVIIVGLLVMVITATVLTFFTLDATTRQSCRTIQLFASTFLAALAFLPIPLVALAVFLPWRHDAAFPLPDGGTSRIDKFGTGRFRTKIGLLLFTSALLTLGAGFRVGVAFDPRPIFSPAWFHHRACFYVFNFVIELVVVYTYALVRFDRRFHIPDGSSAPGHYSSGLGHKSSRLGGDLHVNDESDVFGPDETARPITSQRAQERQWEQRAREELEKEPEEV